MSFALKAKDLRRVREVMEMALRPGEFASTTEWRRALLDAAKPILGADRGGFVTIHPEQPIWVADYPVPRIADYDRRLVSLVPEANVWAHQAALGVHHRDEVWLPLRPDFYETPYYHDFLRPIRAFDALGLTWYREGDDPGAGVHQFLLHHDTEEGSRFGAREKAILELLAPAVRAGAEHAERLPGLMRTGLDAVATPCLLLDSGGSVLHRNPAAGTLLKELPGRERELVASCVRLAVGDDGPDGVGAGIRRLVRFGERTVAVSATRLPLDQGRTGWLVTLEPRAAGAPREALEAAGRARGLTRRQAQVAALMARRRTYREIADELDISPHTARRHEEAVLRGLSVGSRSEILDELTRPGPDTGPERGRP